MKGDRIMGLDGVELLLHVEESFGIVITDEEAGSMHKVQDLYRCVIARLERLPGRAGLSSHVFYRLRRALMERLGVARRAVRPDTPMESLLPAKDRRKAWRELTGALAPKSPALVAPAFFYLANGLLFAGMAVAGGVKAYAHDSALIFFGYLLAGGFFCMFANWLATPWATRIPWDCDTAGDLVKILLRDNYGSLAEERQKWSELEVWAAVKAIIVEELGVRPEEVTPGARFIEDLNMS